MKYLFIIFAILVPGTTVLAQSAAIDTSGAVTVINQKWYLERGAKIPEESKYKTEIDPRQESRQVILDQRENETRAGNGQPPIITPALKRRTNSPPATRLFHYEATVKNNSPKKITALTWEYVFSAPVNNQEIGRRRFTSRQSISRGKRKRLEEQSSLPPTATISASGKATAQYAERIEIISITYADGTRWNSATK